MKSILILALGLTGVAANAQIQVQPMSAAEALRKIQVGAAQVGDWAKSLEQASIVAPSQMQAKAQQVARDDKSASKSEAALAARLASDYAKAGCSASDSAESLKAEKASCKTSREEMFDVVARVNAAKTQANIVKMKALLEQLSAVSSDVSGTLNEYVPKQ